MFGEGGVMRFVVPLIVAAALLASAGADEPKRGPVSRPAINHDLFERLKADKGKLTEQDVFDKLGHPDEVQVADTTVVIADVDKIWTDSNEITVEFRNGKAVSISGRFSPASPSKRLNETILRRLKAGVTPEEVDKVLGPGAVVSETGEKLVQHHWFESESVRVGFKDGKVADVSWGGGGLKAEKK